MKVVQELGKIVNLHIYNRISFDLQPSRCV